MDKCGQSVLSHACLSGNVPQIKLLLEKGAKLDKILYRFKFVTAADLEIAKLLIDGGADPNEIYDDKDKTFLLFNATKNRNIRAVDWLLSIPQVKVDMHNGNGTTALRMACANGSQLIARMLLNKGADPNIIGEGESTPFIRSIQTQNYDITQMLLPHNISVDIQNQDGNSALHFAARDNKTDLVYQLLVLGADKNLKNKEGQTPSDFCGSQELFWVMQNYEKITVPRVDSVVPAATIVTEKDDHPVVSVTEKDNHPVVSVAEKDDPVVSVAEKDDSVKFIIPQRCRKIGQVINIGRVSKICTYSVWNKMFKCWDEGRYVLKNAECEYIVDGKIPYHKILVGEKFVCVRFNAIYTDLAEPIMAYQMYE